MLHFATLSRLIAMLAVLALAPFGGAGPVLVAKAADVRQAPAETDLGPLPRDMPAMEPRRHGTLFYFFSPDWRPTDLGILTGAVEETLASGGLAVSFQAFTRYEDFERQTLLQPPVFIIAPAWVERAAPSDLLLQIHVLARPIRKGKTSYRKALMTRASIDSIDDLARGSIAATVHSMAAGDPASVLQVFHLTADSAKVVPVPKDVDALLALSFGQVDAALVTSEQYDVLARTNPAEAEKMRVLAFSPEVKLPPVFAAASADADLRGKLRDLLVRLPEIRGGAAVLGMLGFDQFVAEVPADAESRASPPASAAPSPAPARPPIANKAAPAKKSGARATSRRR